jgi:hypothetical protein
MQSKEELLRKYDQIHTSDSGDKQSLVDKFDSTYSGKSEEEKKKMGFLEQLKRQFHDLSGGMYRGLSATTRGLGYLADQTPAGWITKALGKTPPGQVLAEKPAQWLSEQGRGQSAQGMPEGLTKSVYQGVGQFAADYPFIASGAGIMGTPGALGLYGAATGGGEGGTEGALLGGATGALSGGIIGGISQLPAALRPAVGLGTGYALGGEDKSEKIANALLWGAMSAGGEKVDTTEFLKRYGYKPGVLVGKKKAQKIKSELEAQAKEFGKLSSEQQKILNQVGKEKRFNWIKYPETKKGWDEFLFHFIDSNIYIKRLTESLKKQPKPENDPYWGARSYPGVDGKWRAQLQAELREMTRPLVERGQLENWQIYVQSMRSFERARNGFKNPNGVTAADAAKAVLKLKKDLPPKEWQFITQKANEFYSWNRENVLGRLVKSGILSWKEAEAMMAKGKYHIPFEKIGIKDAERLLDLGKVKTGEDFSAVVDDVIFKTKGMRAEDKIKHPLEAIQERAYLALRLSEKNDIRNKIIENAAQDPVLSRVIFKLKKNETPPEGLGSFTRIRDGKVEEWAAPSGVVRSLKAMTTKEAGVIGKMFTKSASALRAGATAFYIPFSITNIPRDIQQAWVVSKYGMGPVMFADGLIEGLRSAFGFPTQTYKTMMMNKGGFSGLAETFGGSGGSRPKFSTKELTRDPVVQHVKDAVGLEKLFGVANISQAGELAPRIATVKKALKKGETPFTASMMGRQATIDFGVSGHTVRVVNKFIPFLNARIQAKANIAEALFKSRPLLGNEVQAPVIDKKMRSQVGAAFRAMTLIQVPQLALHFLNKTYFPEWYEALPGDYKDRYFCIPNPNKLWAIDERTGGKRPHVILIAKGDVGEALTNPVIDFLEWAETNDPKGFQKTALNFLQALSPVDFEKSGRLSGERAISSVVGPVGNAAAAGIMGRNLYWERDVVPWDKQRVKPSLQYDETTPGVYRKIGQITGASPYKTEAAARALFGSVVKDPTPAGTAEQVKRRVARDVPHERINKSWDTKKEAEQGYFSVRLEAERLIKAGKIQEALDKIKEWNKNGFWKVLGDRKSLITVSRDVDEKPDSLYKRFTFQNSDISRLMKDARK